MKIPRLALLAIALFVLWLCAGVIIFANIF